MNISPYILAVCLLTVPGDPELSVELCRMKWESEQRNIVPDNPLPDMPGFYNAVAGVCFPKSKC